LDNIRKTGHSRLHAYPSQYFPCELASVPRNRQSVSTPQPCICLRHFSSFDLTDHNMAAAEGLSPIHPLSVLPAFSRRDKVREWFALGGGGGGGVGGLSNPKPWQRQGEAHYIQNVACRVAPSDTRSAFLDFTSHIYIYIYTLTNLRS
jgi:hypothetical protein